MGGNETEIDFVMVGKNNKKYLKDVKAISWELQHRLMVTDMDKGKFKKVLKNEPTVRKGGLKIEGKHYEYKILRKS